MRPIGILCLILLLMAISAGCGQRVPVRNASTGKPTWGQTTRPPGPGATEAPLTIVPTPTGALMEVTVMPSSSVTVSPVPTYRSPPPPGYLTGNYTTTDEKTLYFSYNRSAFVYNLTSPPLIIESTLTVPNITRTRVISDPVSGADKIVDITYPDPIAWFEVTVKDTGTGRIVATDGFARQYSVDYVKKIWIRYPGIYYIEFAGNKVTANVKLRVAQVLPE